MKCSESLELISLSIDGESDARQESMLRFHLNGCADCRRALEISRTLSGAVASLPDFTPPPNLEAAVKSRLSLRDYDTSPLKTRVAPRFVLLRRAAVIIPFAAMLIFAARIFMPPVAPVSASGNSEEQYTPVPPSAYTRPVTLTTF
ncbi:MAG: zf-HC2 domain-containing protein [Candidatus Fermentibacteraceae bacterium]